MNHSQIKDHISAVTQSARSLKETAAPLERIELQTAIDKLVDAYFSVERAERNSMPHVRPGE